MKKVLLAVAAAFMLFACGGGASSNSPVDQLLDLIENNKEYLLNQDAPEAAEVAEKAEAIFEANKDYVLTASDKEHLKKTVKSLAKDALKVIPADQLQQLKDAGMDINDVLDAQFKEVESKIDQVKTLGDLNGDLV